MRDGEDQPPSDRELVERWLDRVTVARNEIEIRLTSPEAEPHRADPIVIPWPARNGRPHREILVPPGTDPDGLQPMRADTRQTLVTAIARARLWWQELESGAASDTAAIAAREGTTERQVRTALLLAFLAPDITRAALEGRLPAGHGVSKLLAYPALSWELQRQRIGPSV